MDKDDEQITIHTEDGEGLYALGDYGTLRAPSECGLGACRGVATFDDWLAQNEEAVRLLDPWTTFARPFDGEVVELDRGNPCGCTRCETQRKARVKFYLGVIQHLKKCWRERSTTWGSARLRISYGVANLHLEYGRNGAYLAAWATYDSPAAAAEAFKRLCASGLPAAIKEIAG